MSNGPLKGGPDASDDFKGDLAAADDLVNTKKKQKATEGDASLAKDYESTR